MYIVAFNLQITNKWWIKSKTPLEESETEDDMEDEMDNTFSAGACPNPMYFFHLHLIIPTESQANQAVVQHNQLNRKLEDAESKISEYELELKTLQSRVQILEFQCEMAKEQLDIARKDRVRAISDRNLVETASHETENRLHAERNRAREELKSAVSERDKAWEATQRVEKELAEYQRFFMLGNKLASYN